MTAPKFTPGEWRPLAEFYPPGTCPIGKCPNYGLCGEYYDMGRESIRPGKIAVLCRFCVRDLQSRAALGKAAHHG